MCERCLLFVVQLVLQRHCSGIRQGSRSLALRLELKWNLPLPKARREASRRPQWRPVCSEVGGGVFGNVVVIIEITVVWIIVEFCFGIGKAGGFQQGTDGWFSVRLIGEVQTSSVLKARGKPFGNARRWTLHIADR